MSDMRQMTQLGRQIETGSFAIIDQEAGAHDFPKEQWQVVRRVIHATADFEFKNLMTFHPAAVERGIQALQSGCPIITDVKMIIAGLNQPRLDHYGCHADCFISDDDVIQMAQTKNNTRAIESMRKAHRLKTLDGSIVAIGNASHSITRDHSSDSRRRSKPSSCGRCSCRLCFRSRVQGIHSR